jgi:hypothetical protein
MEFVTAGEIQKLLKTQSSPCVSIYMPTHYANKEVRQDSIRLKNLLRKAEEQLTGWGMSSQDAQAYLTPALSFLDNSMFLEHQSHGASFFLSREGFQHYHVPLEMKELVTVGSRFHLMPLLPLLTQSDHFYILALSQKKLRLYDATLQSIREVDLKNVPTNIDAALQLDLTNKGRQYRVETGSGAAQRPGSYHGQGAGMDSIEHKKDILRYFQMVDRALQAQVLPNDRPLMVLAGAEYELPLYREANTYPNLVDGGVATNPSGLDLKELHARGKEIIRPLLVQRQQAVINQYHGLMGTSRISESLEDILRAAHGGRVSVFLAPAGMERWGRFDAHTSQVELHSQYGPGDEDLLNVAAVQTLLHDGTVYVLQPDMMPDHRQAAAVFRY